MSNPEESEYYREDGTSVGIDEATIEELRLWIGQLQNTCSSLRKHRDMLQRVDFTVSTLRNLQEHTARIKRYTEDLDTLIEFIAEQRGVQPSG